MNISERIRELCKERGITVAKLEKDCGFANGYIARIKEMTVPADRLHRIEEYFDLPAYSLLEDRGVRALYQLQELVVREEHEENAPILTALRKNPELKLLFDLAKDSSPEDINILYQMLLALKRKERK